MQALESLGKQRFYASVPVLGPTLFNAYINDLFLFISRTKLHNYADDNTLAYFSKNLSNLIEVLEEEVGVALFWLKHNQMISIPRNILCIPCRY